MKQSQFLFLCAILAGCAASPATYKSDPASWTKPRHVFSPLTYDLLVVSVAENTAIEANSPKQYSADNAYYFVEQSGAEYSLLVYTDRKQGLRLSVPKYKHRPIGAKWINPKLLYVEVFFNPHYGAYWMFDVQNERVILQELQNDGVDAWRQVKESRRKRN